MVYAIACGIVRHGTGHEGNAYGALGLEEVMGAASSEQSALVVLSGGQDSTTCLYWALRQFDPQGVSAVTIDYGQRHRVEIAAATTVAQMAGVPHRILPLNSLEALGGNALADDAIAVAGGTDPQTSLPNTFVPARNVLLLSLAAALAYRDGIRHLVTGVAQTDYSGYPDCRAHTIEALAKTLRFALESRLEIHTPLMYLTKAQTVRLAQELGALPALAWTHTCYNGAQPPCGACPACALRAKGFAEAGVPDPLVERLAGQVAPGAQPIRGRS